MLNFLGKLLVNHGFKALIHEVFSVYYFKQLIWSDLKLLLPTYIYHITTQELLASEYTIDVVVHHRFKVSNDFVRVGVVQYATFPRTSIEMGNYEDKLDLQSSLSRMNWQSGNTYTARALR